LFGIVGGGGSGGDELASLAGTIGGGGDGAGDLAGGAGDVIGGGIGGGVAPLTSGPGATPGGSEFINPEPASFALFGSGLLGAAWLRRRRKARRA